MKTTAVAILALLSASALAQPIVIHKDNGLDTRDIAATDATRPHLETRKFHFGNFLKSLFSRNDDGDLSVVARDLSDDNDELLARDFHDEFLDARDFEDNYYLEARGFDDMLEARGFEDYLEARNFDDGYLEMRDLEARNVQEMPRVAGG